MGLPSVSTDLRFASALSSHADSSTAAEQVCDQAGLRLGSGGVDLALLFFSPHHVAAAEDLTRIIRDRLQPGCLLGVSAESVLAGPTELERSPGISLLAARLPGVVLHRFSSDDFPVLDTDSPDVSNRLADGLGLTPETRGVFLLMDPFSAPVVRLLPAMNAALASRGAPRAPVFGGMASAARSAGGNVLIQDRRVMHAGSVGVTFSGAVRIETVVSQGCRGFGPTMVITKARGNIISELGGRPALQAIREIVDQLGEDDRKLLEGGLFIGRVINEYKDRFGRDDFLVRSVVGVDQKSGAIAVGDLVRVGQTVRAHLRDSRTADEDLSLLLDAQKLYERPAGAICVTCNGRGTQLFDAPHHDAAAICRAFGPLTAGEELAKTGRVIDPTGEEIAGADPLPMAGFFAAGEIGPVGGQSFLHGQTASVALFRPSLPSP
jgi:small ligand-binding sensory domain FIST